MTTGGGGGGVSVSETVLIVCTVVSGCGAGAFASLNCWTTSGTDGAGSGGVGGATAPEPCAVDAAPVVVVDALAVPAPVSTTAVDWFVSDVTATGFPGGGGGTDGGLDGDGSGVSTIAGAGAGAGAGGGVEGAVVVVADAALDELPPLVLAPDGAVDPLLSPDGAEVVCVDGDEEEESEGGALEESSANTPGAKASEAARTSARNPERRNDTLDANTGSP
jgi:hypothetical protein